MINSCSIEISYHRGEGERKSYVKVEDKIL